VIVHPGSGGRRKCWPAERFLGLIQGLSKAGHSVLALHGPAEQDLVPTLRSELPSRSVLLPSPELPRLAALLSLGRLFVGNDAGPGHIAAAVGTPTLTLFGPTDPRVWAPRSDSAEWLRAPDGRLAELAVDAVLDRALEMLRREHDSRQTQDPLRGPADRR
jgi:heptosyltransferase-2